MRSPDVIEVLDALDAVGVPVVIEGGWGVDALLGSETRDHSDLDVALERSLLPLAQVVLEKLGFDHAAAAEPGLPARFVMKDGRGRQVDLHPLVFDEAGNGLQQLTPAGDRWGRYPAPHLQSAGIIGGRTVACISAELQVEFHQGYERSDNDRHDLELLARLTDDGPDADLLDQSP